MLSPRYLAGCSDYIVKIYAQLEHDIITDMARRLSKLGKVTESSEWQAGIFQQIGGLQQDIRKYLQKYDTQAQKQLESLILEAIEKSTKTDLVVFNAAKRSMNEGQKQILEATAEKVQSAAIVTGSKKVQQEAKDGFKKTFTGLQRLTMTIADTASGQFVTEANAAYMKVVSGAFDYKTALKQSVNALAQKGVYTVEYTDSGTRRLHTIEGAVRSNILTGINQTTQQVTLDNCKELDCDLVEVSAHMGARPTHAEWQGQIYSLSGKVYNKDGSLRYNDFYEVCKPGTPDGICGINCRHSYYPYFEGLPPHYTDDELDEMKEPSVKYNGQKITQYEAEQKLRSCEREVRKYKRMADANTAAGLDSTKERQLVGNWQAAARDLVEQTGIRRDYNREYIGTKAQKQPRSIKAGSLESKTAKKASELFPLEKWEKKSESIFVAESRKPLNKQDSQKFDKEIAMAKIAEKNGHTTYFVPEQSLLKTNKGKKFDVIMDGVETEFKEVKGGANAISDNLRDSLKQGKNSYLSITQDIPVKRVKEIIHGRLKGKDDVSGIIYVYFSSSKKLYRWNMKDFI